jgi:hypothetical protein
MPTEFTFDSDEYVALVYGPRGGVIAFFTGASEAEVRGPAMAAWQAAQTKFDAKDTGAPPIWEVYKRLRTSPNS